MTSKVAIVIATVAGAFAVDQAAKWMILNVIMAPPRVIEITPFFNLRLGFNTGVSFGMFKDVFEDRPSILTSFKLLVASGLIFWALRTMNASERVGLSLIAGGALGMPSTAIARALLPISWIFTGQAGTGRHSIWPTWQLPAGPAC